MTKHEARLIWLKKMAKQHAMSLKRDKENPLQIGDVVRCTCELTHIWYNGLIGTILGFQCYSPIVQFGNRSVVLARSGLVRI